MNYLQNLLVLVLVSSLAFISCDGEEAQEPDPVRRKSPIAITKVKHADTYVKVVYGQPYRNGREIFGELVPYGEVWRTGANEATELTTTRDILFAGRELPAGTYSLFSIPGEEAWTIILNGELGLWGAFDYDVSKDILRVDVPSGETDQVTEVFTIQFEEVQSDSTTITMRWDQTEVRIPLGFLTSDN